jgi:hypothetical protein
MVCLGGAFYMIIRPFILVLHMGRVARDKWLVAENQWQVASAEGGNKQKVISHQ